MLEKRGERQGARTTERHTPRFFWEHNQAHPRPGFVFGEAGSPIAHERGGSLRLVSARHGEGVATIFEDHQHVDGKPTLKLGACGYTAHASTGGNHSHVPNFDRSLTQKSRENGSGAIPASRAGIPTLKSCHGLTPSLGLSLLRSSVDLPWSDGRTSPQHREARGKKKSPASSCSPLRIDGYVLRNSPVTSSCPFLSSALPRVLARAPAGAGSR